MDRDLEGRGQLNELAKCSVIGGISMYGCWHRGDSMSR